MDFLVNALKISEGIDEKRTLCVQAGSSKEAYSIVGEMGYNGINAIVSVDGYVAGKESFGPINMEDFHAWAKEFIKNNPDKAPKGNQ